MGDMAEPEVLDYNGNVVKGGEKDPFINSLVHDSIDSAERADKVYGTGDADKTQIGH